MQTPEEHMGDLVKAYEEARQPPTLSPHEVRVDHGVVAVLDLIRERDAEVAEAAKAEALAEFEREDVAPFHGHGHTEPGYWRLVGPKHYQPLPEPPTKAEARAICERFGITETEPNRDQEDR